MCTVTSHSGEERTSTIPCADKKDFSTQVAHVGETYKNILEASAGATLHHAFPSSLDVLGRDADIDSSSGFAVVMSMEQANAAAIGGAFDKIILLLEHGEVDYARSRNGAIIDEDLSLTSKGYGKALSVSGETAVYCYEGENSALCPELFVVPPVKCAAESLLVAFPYYSPDSIHAMKWICHGSCMEDDTNDGTVVARTPVEKLERMFPGIDYSAANEDKSDFLAWLSKRDERIIAVASTPSWVRSFCGGSQVESKTQGLRAVGIKL